jgi:mono/diheme cytochrome c family protein
MSHTLNSLAFLKPAVLFVGLLLVAACGGSSGESGSAETSGPTEEQLRVGFGPIENVDLGPIDPTLVATGEEVFTIKCTACHKLDSRYVAPPLGDVTTRRAPEFIMNMMLDPEGMVQQHPDVKALLAEYLTPMPNQQLTQEEARAVLEYLRQAADSL